MKLYRTLLLLLTIFFATCTSTTPTVHNDSSPAELAPKTIDPTNTDHSNKEASIDETVPEPVLANPNFKATAQQTRLEKEMLAELNLLRSNPAGYIPYVESYISRIKSGTIPPDPSIDVEVEYAQSLISTLRSLKPLSKLERSADLFNVAQGHGLDLKRRNNLMSQDPHEGSDGSDPGERIAQGTGLDGGENFGTGHESARDQIVSLLVDAGVPSLGHRNNILNPDWKYATGYYIGNIGEFDACWLQLFAVEKGRSTKGSKTNVDVSPQAINAVRHEVESTVFLTRPEKEMIHEINRIRSNPKAYISEVEAYIARVRSGAVFTMVDQAEEIAVAQELIDELREMEPLSLLKPSRKLYDVAVDHGSFLLRQGQIDRVNPHRGSGGLGAFERIKQEAGYSFGGENFVGGRETVKESVMELLVDSGIGSKGNRGHRLTLLDPIWEFVICYEIGTISTSMGIDQNNCWLQNFAKQ